MKSAKRSHTFKTSNQFTTPTRSTTVLRASKSYQYLHITKSVLLQWINQCFKRLGSSRDLGRRSQVTDQLPVKSTLAKKTIMMWRTSRLINSNITTVQPNSIRIASKKSAVTKARRCPLMRSDLREKTMCRLMHSAELSKKYIHCHLWTRTHLLASQSSNLRTEAMILLLASWCWSRWWARAPKWKMS